MYLGRSFDGVLCGGFCGMLEAMRRIRSETFRTRLREFLDSASNGERIIVTVHGKDIAEVGPVTYRDVDVVVGESNDVDCGSEK